MKKIEIKVKNNNFDYSIVIGNNILNILPKKIKLLCPNAQKIAIVADKNIPSKFKTKIKRLLKFYEVSIFEYDSSEKTKSFSEVNILLEKCLKKNFNRSDIMIALGGGIIGDFSAFVASLIKRGINFINLPSTLLGQVDSAIGGKTGVNSKYGKNLIGTFYQPRLVISDLSLLNSLPKREITCGYAEILKHSIISDKKFFNWLTVNTKNLLNMKNLSSLQFAVFKSCKIKLSFVNKDVNENNIRMMLNFGHTFAHAIEAKNQFTKKINHGEAVLIGMMLASKVSLIKKTCTQKTFDQIKGIYDENTLNYSLADLRNKTKFTQLIKFMFNDKKNNDKKINFILLKNIGKHLCQINLKFQSAKLKNFQTILLNTDFKGMYSSFKLFFENIHD